MSTRLPSLDGRLTTFASGSQGSPAHEPGADVLAAVIDGDVDGLDISAHLTADGVVVAADSGRIRAGLRRKRIDQLGAADLPPEIPTVASLLGRTADPNPLLVNVDGDAVFDALLRIARDLGPEVERRLWLVGLDHADLIRWRPRTGAVLLLGTARRRLGDGVEKLLAALHGDDLDGVSMPHADWSGGTIALAHRFGLRTHASGARHNRELAAVIDAGVDAISAADPIRLAAVAAQYYPQRG